MRREAGLLRTKALDSLILSVEHFNRPSEQGRVPSVLILLDHAFEMLLKAAITHRGGSIRKSGVSETIGFDACVRKCLSDGKVRFLDDDQALTLQTINGLRDAAQHHLLDISEGQFYIHVQTGVTLFRDILRTVFAEELAGLLPALVLPISTIAPTDITTLFDSEISEIRSLIGPKKRRHTEAFARLRPLAIFDATIQGKKMQPSEEELGAKCADLQTGKTWQDVFPGVAAIQVGEVDSPTSISLRITKKEGIPVHLVPEGTPGSSVIGVKRVSELDFYNLNRDQLAKAIGLSGPRTTSLIRYLDLKSNLDYYKEIAIDKTRHPRYSQRAISVLKEAVASGKAEESWKKYPANQPKR